MRRYDEARQLLVGIVGQREDDPRRLRSRFDRADFDAPDDAVCARRGRDMDPAAWGAVVFDRAGEVDCVGVSRYPHRLNRQRRQEAREDGDEQNREAYQYRQTLSFGCGVVGQPAQSAGAGGDCRGRAQNNLRQGWTPAVARAPRPRSTPTAPGSPPPPRSLKNTPRAPPLQTHPPPNTPRVTAL